MNDILSVNLCVFYSHEHSKFLTFKITCCLDKSYIVQNESPENICFFKIINDDKNNSEILIFCIKCSQFIK